MISLTLSRATDLDINALVYSVQQDGMPVMASTTQLQRALTMLERQCDRLERARRHHTITFWDGDKGASGPFDGAALIEFNATHQNPEER
jgi:hypothetical protein